MSHAYYIVRAADFVDRNFYRVCSPAHRQYIVGVAMNGSRGRHSKTNPLAGRR